MKKEIRQYKKNNRLDLEKIIDEYSNYVYTIIKNMAKNYLLNEEIEEIVSDTFFVLWKNREKLDDEKLLSSYIAGIVRNLVREKTRDLKINYNILDYENLLLDNTKIDTLYEQREEIYNIENIVKKMKKQDIEIFKLYYFSSMKIKQISQTLNMTEFNVKSKLYRIRNKIKKELMKGGYSDEK